MFKHFKSKIFDPKQIDLIIPCDTTKRLISSPKCRSVEVINNPARPGSNHIEVNCINYSQQQYNNNNNNSNSNNYNNNNNNNNNEEEEEEEEVDENFDIED